MGLISSGSLTWNCLASGVVHNVDIEKLMSGRIMSGYVTISMINTLQGMISDLGIRITALEKKVKSG